MKKNIFFALAFFAALNVMVSAQNKKTVHDDKTGKDMLIGLVSASDFQDTAYAPWWNAEYKSYLPDSVLLASLSDKIGDLSISIVMGTWCSDSQREVPRFYKILDALKYPIDKIKIICVDRGKKSLQSNDTKALNIELVPTFIFYRGNKEIGRIVESPEESLESDLFDIVE